MAVLAMMQPPVDRDFLRPRERLKAGPVHGNVESIATPPKPRQSDPEASVDSRPMALQATLPDTARKALVIVVAVALMGYLLRLVGFVRSVAGQ